MSLTHPGLPGQQPNWIVGDRQIEQTVRAMLADMEAGETAYISASAHDGVLTLNGTVSDCPGLARFKSRVESAMPGINIDDRLEWVLPDCGIGIA